MFLPCALFIEFIIKLRLALSPYCVMVRTLLDVTAALVYLMIHPLCDRFRASLLS